jgi:hypothetical protein
VEANRSAVVSGTLSRRTQLRTALAMETGAGKASVRPHAATVAHRHGFAVERE